MGEIGCRRAHSTKLVDICSEIFVESASNLCAFFYDVIIWQLPINSVSAKADRKHVYFMDATRRNGVRLCACGCFGRTLRLKVRVHGGVFVATNSQIASCESGMPFESL